MLLILFDGEINVSILQVILVFLQKLIHNEPSSVKKTKPISVIHMDDR